VLYYKEGKGEEALADFTEALHQLGKLATAAKGLFRPEARLANVHVKRALASVWKDQLEAALVDCDEALRLNPREATAYRTRAEIHHRKGEHAKAKADLARANSLKLP
jgi:tetratricopeptide (TPR) repeat protein